jgi:rhamnulose-1-phosphate aldolase/alcohol dehydrogenase
MAVTTVQTPPIRPPVNRWRTESVTCFLDQPLELLAYRSNLLGSDRSVANWGGGNTSCKAVEIDFRGRSTRVLWVKGSGSDLGTIRPHQFTALRMEDILPLLHRESMDDSDLVAYYEHAALRPGQPRASIETPLHSMLPYEHIDHTHPDAIITLCASPDGPQLARRLWSDRAIWVDYERPGFALGKRIAALVQQQPRAICVLMAKHGLVTWGTSAEECYAHTIDTIARAAEALAQRADKRRIFASASSPDVPREALVEALPALRGAVSSRRPMVLRLDTSESARAFASRLDVAELAGAGPACPDHLVHTKPWPLVMSRAAFDGRDKRGSGSESGGGGALARAFREGVATYERRYADYVAHHAAEGAHMRDPAPRVVLVPGLGVVTTGSDAAQAAVAAALYERAIAVLSTSAGMGGFAPLTESETFGVEYWPMELYKLSLLPAPRELAGQVALVTGGASGIGRAVAHRLADAGAHVVIADRNGDGAESVARSLVDAFGERRALAVEMDVTDETAISYAFDQTVLNYGGVDIVVSNAGISTSHPVEETSLDEWNLNLSVLGTGYFLVAREAFRILRRQARGGSVVFVASKNGLAAGRNASAYSSAKALEIHLARCLAEEGGSGQIRVNTVNPDAVLHGSGIWSSAWRDERARTYGIRPDQLEAHYRERTTLKVNVLPEDVAEAVLFFASNRSAKSTGNILNVDGGVTAAYAR